MRYIFLLGVVIWLAGCSEVDNVEPSGSKEVWFDSHIGLSAEEAAFCDDFFKETGTYLLFNDTLRREFLGIDRYGNEAHFTETVDFSWTNLTTTSSTKYLFSYLARNERIETGEFLRDRVLNRFERDIRPFSILFVDTIASWEKTGYSDYSDYAKKDADIPYLLGFRCYAFAIHDWQHMTETEKATLADTISFKLVINVLKRYSGEPGDAFYTYGHDYYGKMLAYYPDIADHRNVGFLEISVSSWGTKSFLSKEKDAEMFAELCFHSTDEEVNTAYSDYPIILKKYELMKEMLEDLGYHLNK